MSLEIMKNNVTLQNQQTTIKSEQASIEEASKEMTQKNNFFAASSKDSEMNKEGHDKERMLKNAISLANSKMKQGRTMCEFSYHEETKRISIKVLDQDTHEVIREIPPEKTLQMVEKMWELAGILVDEKR